MNEQEVLNKILSIIDAEIKRYTDLSKTARTMELHSYWNTHEDCIVILKHKIKEAFQDA